MRPIRAVTWLLFNRQYIFKPLRTRNHSALEEGRDLKPEVGRPESLSSHTPHVPYLLRDQHGTPLQGLKSGTSSRRGGGWRRSVWGAPLAHSHFPLACRHTLPTAPSASVALAEVEE